MLRRYAVLVLAAGLLAGCGTAPPPVPTTPALVVVTPGTGRSLADAGFTCPVAALIWLPSGTELTYYADQPNLVIASGPLAQAGGVQTYLRDHLPGLGWRITADTEGGLLFEQGVWRGGFATGTTTWALTVRND